MTSLLMLSTSSLIEASAAMRTGSTIYIRDVKLEEGYSHDLRLGLNGLLTIQIAHFVPVSPEFA